MSTSVCINWADDDHVSIEVNGEEVAAANYDDHGRSGMRAVIDAATAVAEATGLHVHTEGIANA